MEVKHYAEGSSEPSLEAGKTYLYSMRYCPFAHRAHLALNAKQAPYQTIFINLASKPKWYLNKIPGGRVPLLSHKGELIYESLILAEFVNEAFPGICLYPCEPIGKAKDKLLIEKFGAIGGPFHKLAIVEFDSESFNTVLNILNDMENELLNRKTPFFGGDEPIMVDYMIWPWFERLDALAVVYGGLAKIPYEKYPNLEKWISLMKSDDAVKKHFASAEEHAKHFTLRKNNNPDAFDFSNKK